MPTRALHMRKIRDLIRLKYEARLSHEQIAGALAISKGVVAKYVARIERTGLEPSVLISMSDAASKRASGTGALLSSTRSNSFSRKTAHHRS
jgi:DNA-binding transcriptional regulator LsrR (DeoR family)